MPKPIVYKSSKLKEIGLCDARERSIKHSDLVDITCKNCSEKFNIKFSFILKKVRYGAGYWLCHSCASSGAVEKRKQTNIEKYGCENPMQNPDTKNKHQDSIMEKYGVKNSFQIESSIKKAKENRSLPEVQAKIEESNVKKYGVKTALLLENSKEKAKKAMVEAHGVERGFDSETIRKKGRESIRRKYGVNAYPQSEEYWKNLRKNLSQPEQEIKEFIESICGETQKIRINGYEFDIVTKNGIAIEHNGLYAHRESSNFGSAMVRDRMYHISKTKTAEKHCLKLIHIWGHWWIKRREQTKNFLRSAIKGNSVSVGARKCDVIVLDAAQGRDFVEKNHIQSPSQSAFLYVSLMHKGEVLLVASFSRHHRNGKEIVLSRFCCKDNYTIPGGLSKISKWAQNYFKTDIISWADYSISNGSGYIKAGWEKIGNPTPDYFYYNINTKKITSKQSRKRSAVKTPKGVSEREHALKDGFHRIWDCGRIKFIFKK